MRRIRVILTNLTDADSTQLCKLLHLAAKQVHCQKIKFVIVRPARKKYVHGIAILGDRAEEANDKVRRHSGRLRSEFYHAGLTHHVCLYVPNGEVDAHRIAAVAEHEFLHNLGARHGDMTREQRLCKQPTIYAEPFTANLFQASVVEPT